MSVQVIMEIDKGYDRLNVEQHVPGITDKAKAIIRKDACMKVYNEMNPLHLRTDALGICLGTGL